MKEKRFKKKALSALGIAVVLAIGVGLLTVFATSSAAADVSVTQQKGIEIRSETSSVSLGTTFGFGRGYKSSDKTLWRIDPAPGSDDDNVDFRLTVTQHTNMSDVMSKLTISNPSGNLDYEIYAENGKIASDNFYLNPGSGSTTIYVSISKDENTDIDDNFEVTLDSVSWAKTPFSNDNPSFTLVASGKALE